MNALDQIQKMIDENAVVLFMKGTPDFPQCGFSSGVVHILRSCGIDFLGVDVLSDPELRQGIKDFTNWPTIPQLYIHGEFVGGCDIVTDLYERGELQKMFDVA